MQAAAGQLRQRIFGISLVETTFARRGFAPATPATQRHLERIGGAFVQGYHAALRTGTLGDLVPLLQRGEREYRGFAFEGAAMGCALLERFTPWRASRLAALLAGPGADHRYMIHVGVGWAMARLPVRIEATLRRFDPLLRWLAVDGYGFHAGYFSWPRAIGRQEVPRRLRGYARRVFDQGLGRSLWFVAGGDSARIAATIADFPAPRRPDLWSGIGLACTYAGGVGGESIAALRLAARPYQPELAQGAAFAAQARLLADLVVPHTERACALLCGQSVAEAAAITDQALRDLPADGALPAYEVWRQRIRACFAEGVET